VIFQDRREAGQKLAQQMQHLHHAKDTIILGLARGGVAVAAELAESLHLPFDVLVVRKIGAPGNEELALGAVASVGEPVFNEHLIALLGVSPEYLKSSVEREREKIKQRLALYLGGRKAPVLKGKTVVIVDDGIATGASMRAAIQAVRSEKPTKIILAVPVAAPDSLSALRSLVDETICLYSPSFFEAVGAFYKHFEQVSDEQVQNILEK